MSRFLVIVLAFSGCLAPLFGGPIEPGSLHDGVYVASYSHGLNSARVRVTVRSRRIAGVEVLRQGASWIGRRAAAPTCERIVAAQSTNVDAVSGATNSSRVIMNATYVALEKARR